jgi:flagellar motor switch protein FliM
MYIDKEPYFNVYPGTIGNKVGVQISEIIDKDVKEDE